MMPRADSRSWNVYDSARVYMKLPNPRPSFASYHAVQMSDSNPLRLGESMADYAHRVDRWLQQAADYDMGKNPL